MISKHDILEMAKHVARKDRGRADRSLMHPAREWSVSLLVTLVLFVAGGWWAAVSYMTYQDLLNQSSDGQVETVGLKDEVVDAALLKYQAKRTEYERIKAAGAATVVPPASTIAASTTNEVADAAIADTNSATTPGVDTPVAGEVATEATATATPLLSE